MNLIPKNLSQLRRIALAVLLASFAILDTTSISAQELGRTITSPFGIARQTSTSESGSDGDTFIDPETGEVGHIIRNPFGVANPEGVDTGIDIPDSGEEEVGGIITNPFGVPDPDGVDTDVDVFDEEDEYLISLPDDEESDVENSEGVDEVDDETSDDVKEKIDKIEFSEDFSRNDESGIATKGSLPPKDAPRNTGEQVNCQVAKLTAVYGLNQVESAEHNSNNTPVLLFVPKNVAFKVTATTKNNAPWGSQTPKWETSNPSALTGGEDGQAECFFKGTQAGEYVISAWALSPRIDKVHIRVRVMNGPLLYYTNNGNNLSGIEMSDYNGDGTYDLFVPYYDSIRSLDQQFKHQSSSNFVTNIILNDDFSSYVLNNNKPTWDVNPTTTCTLEPLSTGGGYNNYTTFTSQTPGKYRIKVTRAGHIVASADIWIIKLEFEKFIGTGTKYGFDKPEGYHPKGDYKTYVSIEEKQENTSKYTDIYVKLTPYPRDYTVKAKSLNSGKIKLRSKSGSQCVEDELKKPTSSTGTKSPLRIYSVSESNQPTDNNLISISLIHPTNSNKDVDFTNDSNILKAKVYKKSTFDAVQYNYSSKASVTKAFLDDAFGQIVYEANLTSGTFPGNNNPDKNNNGFLDEYPYGITLPTGAHDELKELESYLDTAHPESDNTNPIVLVKGLLMNYPVNIIQRTNNEIVFTSLTPLQYYGEKYNYNINVDDETGERTTFEGFYTCEYVSNNSGVNAYRITDPPPDLTANNIVLGIALYAGTTLKHLGRTVGVAIGADNESNYDAVVVHELGHMVMGYHDTGASYEHIVKIDVMHYESSSQTLFFSCREVQNVVTGQENPSPLNSWESHWDKAPRN